MRSDDGTAFCATCNRRGLPTSPAQSPIGTRHSSWRIPVAHVKPDGSPCTEGGNVTDLVQWTGNVREWQLGNLAALLESP